MIQSQSADVVPRFIDDNTLPVMLKAVGAFVTMALQHAVQTYNTTKTVSQLSCAADV